MVSATVCLFAAVTAGGVFAAVMVNRWIGPEDALPWIIMALSVTIVGIAGICFALAQSETRPLPYVLKTAREVLPIVLAMAAIDAAVVYQSHRIPTADPDPKIREQVERLSAERKDLMKALFAAGKFEVQAGALKNRLQEREASLAASEAERKRLLGDLEAANEQLAVEKNRIAEQSESERQARSEVESKLARVAALEALQQETREELQAMSDDLKRGRRITDARLLKILSKFPAPKPIAAE